MSRNKSFSSGAAPNHDLDPGMFLTELLPLWDRGSCESFALIGEVLRYSPSATNVIVNSLLAV